MKTKTLTMLFIIIIALAISGCTVLEAYTETTGHVTEATPPNATETIKIASWNIENFGKSKATDEGRMREIAKILNGYDIIVLQ